MGLRNALNFSKQVLGNVLSAGDVAVDATVGNGHDTLFLAEQVGATGRVFGFDVQEEALASARVRLQAAGVAERVMLYHTGHEQMQRVLPAPTQGHVRAVMFNLGYLPGGSDKTLVTRPETTHRALEAALQVLAPGGLISVVLYLGHPGGAQEAETVRTWAAALPQERFYVLSYRYINQRHTPPRLLLIERRAKSA